VVWRGFALQRSIDSLFHEALFEMFDGARSDAKCYGRIGNFPWTAVWSGIAQQQCAGIDKGVGCCLPARVNPSSRLRSSSLSVTR